MVGKVSAEPEEYRRLRELGLFCGAEVECVMRRRGIGAYLVRGTVIALRDTDASAVELLRDAGEGANSGVLFG